MQQTTEGAGRRKTRPSGSRTLITTMLISAVLGLALLPGPRLPSPLPRAAAPAMAHSPADLLRECDASAERLATMLTKDALKEECAARSLPVSGTKAALAPRLLATEAVETV